MKSFALLLLAILFTLAACNTPVSELAKLPQRIESNTTASIKTDGNLEIVERYWKLIELDGKAMTMPATQEREAHFILKSADQRVLGHTGCNSFFGSYALAAGGRIRFDALGASKRLCHDLEVNEADYLQVFALADNYRVSGNVLELNVGRRAPLAKFQAVLF